MLEMARRCAALVAALLTLTMVALGAPSAQATTVGNWNVQRASATPRWPHGQAGVFAISGNGRYVAFVKSIRTARGRSLGTHVFAKDLKTGALRKVAPAGGTYRTPVSLSSNGRLLVFPANGSDQSAIVMGYDTRTGEVRRLVSNGDQAVVSGDGRRVVYLRRTWSLGIDGETEIRVLDLVTGADQVVAALAPNGDHADMSISADGQSVAWWMYDADGAHAWHKNLATGVTTRVDANSAGTVANLGVLDSVAPAMTRDGRWVTFVSAATNLAPHTSKKRPRVYLKDTATGSLRVLVSNAYGGALSGDGRYFSYLPPKGGNGFVRRVSGGKPVALPPGSGAAVFSTTGRYLAYQDFSDVSRDVYRARKR
jgi:Tol biopolymer transport system component